ncbi:hypothetical protein BACI349Y_560050 [Bacillus sp. 349Y]|nr:hypothetical protein BACI349Y_560050 [Bacillus sp. 349Y]
MNEVETLKNEIEILKKALGRQAQRVSNLTLDLDLAYVQIEQLHAEKQPSEEQ